MALVLAVTELFSLSFAIAVAVSVNEVPAPMIINRLVTHWRLPPTGIICPINARHDGDSAICGSTNEVNVTISGPVFEIVKV